MPFINASLGEKKRFHYFFLFSLIKRPTMQLLLKFIFQFSQEIKKVK